MAARRARKDGAGGPNPRRPAMVTDDPFILKFPVSSGKRPDPVEILAERLRDHARDVAPVPEKFTKCPEVFIDVTTWIAGGVNLRCHNCVWQFSTFPIFVPDRIEFVEAECGKSRVRAIPEHAGGMCCWCCGAGYVTEKYKNDSARRKELLENLRLMHEIVTHVPVKDIPPMMPFSRREDFGGDVPCGEYRRIQQSIKPIPVDSQVTRVNIWTPGASLFDIYRDHGRESKRALVDDFLDALGRQIEDEAVDAVDAVDADVDVDSGVNIY